MVKINNIKVHGLKRAKKTSGYPLSISINDVNSDDNRAKKLSSCMSGAGHDCFLKGIIVQFDITFPQYFSMQLQRYNWIDIVSSQSKMHTITKRKLGNYNCNKYVDDVIMTIVNGFIEDYNENPTYDGFMQIVSNIPMGYEMTMGITTNYLQLKTIYNQRLTHKLKEDWGNFCKFIKELPDSYLITGWRDNKNV